MDLNPAWDFFTSPYMAALGGACVTGLGWIVKDVIWPVWQRRGAVRLIRCEVTKYDMKARPTAILIEHMRITSMYDVEVSIANTSGSIRIINDIGIFVSDYTNSRWTLLYFEKTDSGKYPPITLKPKSAHTFEAKLAVDYLIQYDNDLNRKLVDRSVFFAALPSISFHYKDETGKDAARLDDLPSDRRDQICASAMKFEHTVAQEALVICYNSALQENPELLKALKQMTAPMKRAKRVDKKK